MKFIFSFLLFSYSYAFFAQGNYISYYILCQKAENFKYVNKFDSARFYYEKAFKSIKEPLLFDEMNLGLVYSSDLDYSKNAFELFKSVLRQGYEYKALEEQISKTKYIHSTYFDSLKLSYKNCRTYFYSNYNADLVGQLNTLTKLDTYIRKNCNQSDSICETLWTNTIYENLVKLVQIIKENGFPGYKQIGYYAMSTNLILLHGKSNKLSIQDFTFLSEVIKKEVLEGNFSPQNYAYWVDGYYYSILKQNQIYGMIYEFTDDGKKKLYSYDSLEDMNEKRKNIGLESINEYCNKFNILIN